MKLVELMEYAKQLHGVSRRIMELGEACSVYEAKEQALPDLHIEMLQDEVLHAQMLVLKITEETVGTNLDEGGESAFAEGELTSVLKKHKDE